MSSHFFFSFDSTHIVGNCSPSQILLTPGEPRGPLISSPRLHTHSPAHFVSYAFSANVSHNQLKLSLSTMITDNQIIISVGSPSVTYPLIRVNLLG